MAPESSAAPRPRLVSLDAVRGIAMVLMALDHARDFFGAPRFDPTDLSRTNAVLFFTRWVTHFCASTFVFLAGTSAYLWKAGGRTVDAQSRFLFTRGLWLILLELTVVGFAWRFSTDGRGFGLQVIWVIGASMIALAAIARLPVRAVGVFGVAIVTLHDALDRVHAEDFGAWRPAWLFLHESGPFPFADGRVVYVVYPLIPWVGVMAAGYALGPLFDADRDPDARRRVLRRLGLALVGAFLVLRLANVYGDPNPWVPGATWGMTVLAVLNCNKYPPSLDFLAMTLGPALLALSALTRVDRGGSSALARAAGWLAVYGKVPLFYYVAHIYALRFLAVLVDVVQHGQISPHLRRGSVFAFPADYGFSLPVVYAVWIAVVLALYPACAWFAGVKARNRGKAWVSYA
jgi:uncharacterized membrane protein